MQMRELFVDTHGFSLGRVDGTGGRFASVLIGFVAVVLVCSGFLVPNAHAGSNRQPVAPKPPNPVFLPIVTATNVTLPFDEVEAGGWLGYLNAYRMLAGLTPVTEVPSWSAGAIEHARYVVKNDYVGHAQDPSNPWHSPNGAAAGSAGNVAGSSSAEASDALAIDWWMQGPFHAVGILDPRLQQVGFGSYREDDGRIQMAAVLDVIRGRNDQFRETPYPVLWPGNNTLVPLASYDGGESPNPLSSCPGYRPPTGPPILLQLGDGSLTPKVTEHAFTRGRVPLPHCVYDETTYTNRNAERQAAGRAALASRDAIVLIPRAPLQPGRTYTVTISANGIRHVWSFTVAPRVTVTASVEPMVTR